MHDILDQICRLSASGMTCGLATVVRASGSTPRPLGVAMVVSADGAVVGSVSGGCADADVYDLAMRVIADGRPRMVTYGPEASAQRPGTGPEADPFAVKLACGGTLDVFVEPLDADSRPGLAAAAADVRAGVPVALATVVGGPGHLGAHVLVRPDDLRGSLGDARLDAAVAADARAMLETGVSGIRHHGADGRCGAEELAVFIQSFQPPARMLLYGATDLTAALVRMGTFLGYRVTVCDARPVFTTGGRFPEAEVVIDWPHRHLAATPVDTRTVVCVLSHDAKFDLPLLAAALRTPAAYIGVLGSRDAQAERLTRLRAMGLTEEQLSCLRAPAGLDLGGATPEETAVSIAAEIVAVRRGGDGGPLSATTGPIHRRSGLGRLTDVR